MTHNPDFLSYERTIGLAWPTGFPPHAFAGRLDRWCEICDRPYRNLVHHTVDLEEKP